MRLSIGVGLSDKQRNTKNSKVHMHILIYVQHDATLNSLFYLETALHVSGDTTTHHQERKQLYPLLSAASGR